MSCSSRAPWRRWASSLAGLPLGAVGAADAGDALGGLRDAGADPDRDEGGEHPAEHVDAARCAAAPADRLASRAASAPTTEERRRRASGDRAVALVVSTSAKEARDAAASSTTADDRGGGDGRSPTVQRSTMIAEAGQRAEGRPSTGERLQPIRNCATPSTTNSGSEMISEPCGDRARAAQAQQRHDGETQAVDARGALEQAVALLGDQVHLDVLSSWRSGRLISYSHAVTRAARRNGGCHAEQILRRRAAAAAGSPTQRVLDEEGVVAERRLDDDRHVAVDVARQVRAR